MLIVIVVEEIKIGRKPEVGVRDGVGVMLAVVMLERR